MGLTTNLHLAVLILTACCVSIADADYNEYIPLISDVRKQYSASSIFFTFSRTNPRMQTYTAVHELSRTFSDQGVLTLIAHAGDLTKHVKHYRKRTGRPLIVLLLKSLDEIAEFNRTDIKMGKRYAIWLVIFHGVSDDRLCEYCRRPVGNMFRLRLDTLMLVLCCGAPVLHEWWSLDGNNTEHVNFGTWTKNERLKLLSTDGIISRRSDLRGTGLRVIIYDPSEFPGGSSNPRVRFFHAYFRELQRAMNFTVTEILPASEGFSWEPAQNKRTTVVGVLMRGGADLAIIGLPIGRALPEYADYSNVVLSTTGKLFIRQPDRKRVHWFAHFEVFSLDIWMIIIALLIITPLLLAVIKAQECSKSLGSLYLEYWLDVWGIFCQQGLDSFPAQEPMRIVLTSIYITAVLMFVAYSTKMISLITMSDLPFRDLLGFLKDGSYQFMTLRNKTDFTFLDHLSVEVFRKLWKSVKPFDELPKTEEEAWEQVCTERVALHIVTFPGSTPNAKCKVVEVGGEQTPDLAMLLPADSQYTAILNYHIQRFKENGVYHRMKKIFSDGNRSIETDRNIVDFYSVAPIFSILAGGIVLALVVLICEYSYYRIHKRRRLHSESIELLKRRMQKWFERWRRQDSSSSE